MEGNASVYQVNPVSRTTGEGRAEIFQGVGAGGGVVEGEGQLNLCSSFKPLKGTNPTGVGGTHQFIMYIL